ncbi:MAG TPA: NADH:flavin oxidoreductase/NADH oxidase [Dehalococcoidia bacterium]|jgi:2,4-dienoyl-CoA reductase-like NADH-dependent reductase (Old Yellow Enzyme family)|nr:NADH:flavin oxidoreductase/NADH oxidase [Dehalococcoidia bacterium]
MTVNSVSESPTDDSEKQLPGLFQPITIKGVTFRNRLVNGPTSLFTCDGLDGKPTAFHMQHIGSHAIGGAGLVLTEAAAVSPEGRTCLEDLGCWSDEHGEAFAPIVRFGQKHGAKVGLQLFHGGRRVSTNRKTNTPLEVSEGGWVPLGPSPLRASPRYPVPREMTREEIHRLIWAYADAAERADRYGFDVIELHSCHGYLLHQFLSPRSNLRTDEYGGAWENRVRFTLEASAAIRARWPDDKPFFVRLSAMEWVEDGWQLEEMIRLAKELVNLGVDVIDVSTGAGDQIELDNSKTAGYILPFAEAVKRELQSLTCTVGLITTPQLANEVIESGTADLVSVSRAFMRDPYFGIHAAEALGCPEAVPWPREYLSGINGLKQAGL